MYESPIEMISRHIRTQQEENVYKAVLEVGVHVDKDELIRALSYDRDQYNKGVHDGMCHFATAARAGLAREIITDLAEQGLLNVESWAIESLIKKYTEGTE